MHHHAQLVGKFSDVPVAYQSAGVDVVVVRTQVLGINEVRDIQKRAYEKSVGESGWRTIVVEAIQIRIEAQNALLKILEEPPVATRFFFVVAESSQLLPTLLSRFAQTERKTKSIDITDAQAFVELSVAQRLTLVAEKTAAKDKEWQRSVLSGLEQLAVKDVVLQKILPLLYNVRKEIVAPGASAKMLLEHVALGLDELKTSN